MRNESAMDDKNILEQGFTLVELLIVIVIMGILAGIVVFAVGNLTGNAQTNSCKTERGTMETAIEAYKAQAPAVAQPTEALLFSTNLIKSLSTNYNVDAVAVPAGPGVTAETAANGGKCVGF